MPKVATDQLIETIDDVERVYIWVEGLLHRGAWIEQSPVALLRVLRDRLGKGWAVEADIRVMADEMWITPHGTVATTDLDGKLLNHRGLR